MDLFTSLASRCLSSRKPFILDAKSDLPDCTAARIVDLMRNAERGGKELHTDIEEVVKPTGWTETLARRTLEVLQASLKEGREEMGPALAACYDKAVTVARREFDDLCRLAKEHPGEAAAAVLLTVVALGVLAELLPLVIELLGFAEVGPVEGRQSSLPM
ncbi:hypothetical protein Purlil1_13786 [Purpureocillium lilacinum]|uniref:Uncharacterized protein n=1 Tax=Purpureocillium lilacinum TaxID=33203 RepID=A0ABR0BD65_PURLI|nr:hypothetical protein Purlil1_13786 [Purpureocillium lilacinum]